MTTPPELFTPVSAKKMENLVGCAARASSLMHLLAIAYIKNDIGTLHAIDPEEAEGIMWLSFRTGNELKAAMDDAFSAPPVALQTPAMAKNPKS